MADSTELCTFGYNHNKSINLWDTLAQKMGPQDEDWNQGAERLKVAILHSLLHLQQSQ